ncbi:MAG: MFS transporter [Polyangiaceae bacterium]|jgi:MFS family permease
MATPPRSFFSASPLAHEAFRAIWIAAIFSNIGTFVQDVGESWLMLSLTKDPLPVAMLTTSFTVPGMALMMPAGVMADRWDRRKILLLAQSIQTTSALVLAVTTWLGAATPAVLLCASAGLGIGSALASPSWNSIVPELVPRALMAEAVTLNSVAFNIARAVGPALGGLVLAARGPGTAFLLNAVSFLAVIEVLRRYDAFKVASSRAVAIAKKRRAEPIRRALFAAFRTVRGTEGLRAAHISVAAFGLAASSFPALLAVFAKVVLGGTARGYGMMLGAIGVGAVAGALLLQRWRHALHARVVVAGAMAMYGLSVLAVSQTRSLEVAVLLLLPAGVGWISSLSSLNALVQLSAPQHVKSRILALYQLTFLTSWSVGSGIGGVAANRFGVGATVTVAGLGVLCAAALSARLPLPTWDAEPTQSEPLVTPIPASVR